MSLDADVYGFATLADAKAAWIEQLTQLTQTMMARGVVIDAILPSAPASQEIVETDGATLAALWAIWRALEGGSITSTY